MTDKPAIYNIKSTMASENPIRLIDTAGFGDVRGPDYDKKITEDIQELFTKEIETLNAICLIFKATETRAHDRAKQVLDKLFSLFGEEIKKNIVIVFTFVDDFNDFTAFKTLQDENSPFIKILGDIKNLEHFEFNNKAYFTTDKERFEKTYNDNAKSFGRLLKYVFSLPSISLESSKKVIENRFEISNKIFNVCHELYNVIQKISTSIRNRETIKNLKDKYENMQESPYNKIPVNKTETKYFTEDCQERLPNGWYCLYCNSCKKECHRDCKGPKEGWHRNEYGCKAIGTLSSSCSNCSCHYSKHNFHDYVWVTKSKSVTVNIVEYVDDPKSIANEKEKSENKKMMNIEIKEKEKELKKLDEQIHSSLNDSLDKLSFIASKELELNKIALKKYSQKNGFCKELLEGTINDKKIQDIFKNTLDDIESICSNSEQKEKSIEEIKNKLL